MNHQIVYQLYYAFVHRGFSVLRFNFRGVGRSQGSFDHGVGELSDSASALDWAQTINPEDRKSTRLNSSHQIISYAVFCLKKKKMQSIKTRSRKSRTRPPRLTIQRCQQGPGPATDAWVLTSERAYNQSSTLTGVYVALSST